MLLLGCRVTFGQNLNAEAKFKIEAEGGDDQVTTLSPNRFSDWNDWETWKPSQEVLKAFPYYRMGYDYDGLVGEFA